jgi:hypothetical protein
MQFRQKDWRPPADVHVTTAMLKKVQPSPGAPKFSASLPKCRSVSVLDEI